MSKRELEWIADDDFNTRHKMSEEFAIKVLKEFYEEWPGGLEEIDSALKSRSHWAARKLKDAQQVISELSELVKQQQQKQNTIWVLTEEYEEYDQYGQYFVHAWVGKPEKEQLSAYVHSSTDLDDLLLGGGRRDTEYHWYNLEQVE